MTDVKVTVRNNGPLRLEGAVSLVDQDGRAFGLGGRSLVSLCRCGRSADKPFCDGAHKQGFDSVVTARDLPPKV